MKELKNEFVIHAETAKDLMEVQDILHKVGYIWNNNQTYVLNENYVKGYGTKYLLIGFGNSGKIMSSNNPFHATQKKVFDYPEQKNQLLLYIGANIAPNYKPIKLIRE